MLSSFAIAMTGATTWSIYVDGKRLDSVRKAVLEIEADSVPTLTLEMFAGRGSAIGNAEVVGEPQHEDS